MTPRFHAILEWGIKERQWVIAEYSCDTNCLRSMRRKYRILCARFPNNSYQLVYFGDASTVERRVVHRDALNRERNEEEPKQ